MSQEDLQEALRENFNSELAELAMQMLEGLEENVARLVNKTELAEVTELRLNNLCVVASIDAQSEEGRGATLLRYRFMNSAFDAKLGLLYAALSDVSGPTD